MPAVFDSLVHVRVPLGFSLSTPPLTPSLRPKQMRGYTPHVAWRISFIVPTILLILCGLGALLLCDDTPTGSWATRDRDIAALYAGEHLPVDDEELRNRLEEVAKDDGSGKNSMIKTEVNEAATPAGVMATGPAIEVVVRPSLRSALPALFCIQTLMLAAPYVPSRRIPFRPSSSFMSWHLPLFPQIPLHVRRRACHQLDSFQLLPLALASVGTDQGRSMGRDVSSDPRVLHPPYLSSRLVFPGSVFSTSSLAPLEDSSPTSFTASSVPSAASMSKSVSPRPLFTPRSPNGS
jgi:hypothetical protein